MMGYEPIVLMKSRIVLVLEATAPLALGHVHTHLCCFPQAMISQGSLWASSQIRTCYTAFGLSEGRFRIANLEIEVDKFLAISRIKSCELLRHPK